MRKVILHNMVTVDGCSSGPNGELDWLFAIQDEGRDAYVMDMYKSMGGAIVGRETYAGMAGYWPSAAKSGQERDREFASMMNQIPKYVLSTTLEGVEWENSTLLKGDTVDAITKLKQEPGKDLVLCGGVRTVQGLLKLGLIDEFQLIVHPVVLGDGKRLFEGLDQKLNLKLAGATPFSSGVVAFHYEKA